MAQYVDTTHDGTMVMATGVGASSRKVVDPIEFNPGATPFRLAIPGNP
jgi:hypothetical protein